MPPAPLRRHDLDWIRVGAFLLLVFYHVGMFYVPWDWHVKSPRLVPALEPAMMLVNPWRLTLLFLVSGAASRFLFDRLQGGGESAPGRFARLRIARLAPPLIFAIFVIVPPQSYYEVVEALAAMGVEPRTSPWLDHFWLRYATGSGHWCDADGCLRTPTWNHMWFVLYLLTYDLVLAAAASAAGGRLDRAVPGIERALRGWRLLAWPTAWLALLRLALAPRFPITDAFVGDWYNHALSLSAVAFGFATARSQALKVEFIRLRHASLAVGIVAWLLLVARARGYFDGAPGGVLLPAGRIVYAVDQWAFIAAALGYAARHLGKGGARLRYLTSGVFCFYVVHQTIIVVVAHHLASAGLPLALEAGLILAATVAGCFGAFEASRRIGWAGLMLGAPRLAARPSPPTPPSPAPPPSGR